MIRQREGIYYVDWTLKAHFHILSICMCKYIYSQYKSKGMCMWKQLIYEANRD